MKTVYNKSEIMKAAHSYKRFVLTRETFAECLRVAWRVAKRNLVVPSLIKGAVVEFIYINRDGVSRTAQGCNRYSMKPKDCGVYRNGKYVVYHDMGANRNLIIKTDSIVHVNSIKLV